MGTDQTIISAKILAEVISNLSQKLRAFYVFPDMACKLCDSLKDHLENGDYADLKEGEMIALALTIHLQEVTQDEHLWVKWHSGPLPDDDRPLRANPLWQAEQKLAAQLDNFGLYRVERLPGNVGYLDIHYFHRPAWAGETAIAAMNFLSNTSALIIDLRKCPAVTRA